MKLIKKVLLDSLEDEIKEVRFVIEEVSSIPLNSKLTSETRTILELINHIAQIPRMDIDIYTNKIVTSEQAQKLEQQLNKKTIKDVLKVFDDNCLYLRKHFEKMTDEDLFKENLNPFYEKGKPPKSWTYFLPKITSHLVLHKGVLWSYQKVAGAKVDMFTYYGMKKTD